MNLARVIEATIAALTVFIACWGLVSKLIIPRFAVWVLYIYVWFIALVVVWVGVVLALAGWVWPKLFGSEAPTASPKDKIVTAAIAAILLYIGKQLLEPVSYTHLDVYKRQLENVLTALRKRFYSPEKLTGDWPTAVERHRPLIESAGTADAFEKAMGDLLAELHTSHLGFFHSSARRASSRAALSATYLEDETPYGCLLYTSRCV